MYKVNNAHLYTLSLNMIFKIIILILYIPQYFFLALKNK